jgi:hypothetical protein
MQWAVVARLHYTQVKISIILQLPRLPTTRRYQEILVVLVVASVLTLTIQASELLLQLRVRQTLVVVAVAVAMMELMKRLAALVVLESSCCASQRLLPIQRHWSMAI